MAHEIKMPQLSDTMFSGKILTWLKKEGETVNRGDALAEVETDKANLQIECFQQGTLLKILVPANATANVGDVIAFVGAAGEKAVASVSNAPNSNGTSTQQASTAPAARVEAPQIENKALSLVTNSTESLGRVKISPLARKIAEQSNIDLATLKGSGPSGRIIRKDVESAKTSDAVAATNVDANGSTASAAPAQTARPAAPQATSAPRPASGTLTPLSKMRETIAKRMVESVNSAPHFYVTVSVVMDEAVRLREILKEREEYKGISINHLVIKAAAYALHHEQRVNYAMRDGQLYNPGQINVGIITAVGEGLLIPVIKDANTLALRDVVFEARAAVDRARAGRPSSTDLVGGTFSISNMGMFDVDNFTAIINPGQGAIIAVGSIQDEVIVKNGVPAVGKRMRATLSVDHRIIDGVIAGTFLKHFKQCLETPALLCL